MGRSGTTSCFKIITCASDSVDRDDLEPSPEGKGSSDKRGWSFRKRSARHRVLSNTVISETGSSGNKESPESATVNFQAQAKSAIPEKAFEVQLTNEIPQFSTSVKSNLSETTIATEDDAKYDANPDESVIVIIQAAVRGFLAQRELLKHKNVVKLQAAVRGHLVRRHAVGTLRCVQAIVKIQALVRARRARLSGEGSIIGEKLDEKHRKDNHSSEFLGKQNSGSKPQLTYMSIETLLSNKFARQLLDSVPRTERVNIRCDPLRSDSAWKWLERWMSASSPRSEQSPKPEMKIELHEQENVQHPENQVETVIASQGTNLISSTVEAAFQCLESSTKEEPVPSENEETLITSDADNFDIQACRPTLPLVSHNLEQPQPENSTEKADSPSNQTVLSHFVSQVDLSSLPAKTELVAEQPKRSMKRSAPEQPETEGRRFGSRKASNPAFIAAQSKFKELGSTSVSARSISSSNQDFGIESSADTNHSVMDDTARNIETDVAANLVPHTSRVQVGGSECGTELSISSTLDSPDQSEVGAVEAEHEYTVLEVGTGNPRSNESEAIEAKVEPTITEADLAYSTSVQLEKQDNVNGTNCPSLDPVVPVDSLQVKQKLEDDTSNLQIELESEAGHQVSKSSPEASPRSHLTVPESQGTPSSQVSAKTKKTRMDKNGSDKKRKSLSAGKRSPINHNHDSGVRSSLEQLPKDHKTGKRRNSFGSPRPDQVDQEPRDSSSSSTLPSYMQATESAKAKAHAISSPRSSPDVLDKDFYIKKRHSLPGSNSRQGSPRIQRSTSQAQQSTKGNGTQPPH
ncbi:hypothetical protein RJ639_004803, partial [Escallonia herrerae]